MLLEINYLTSQELDLLVQESRRWITRHDTKAHLKIQYSNGLVSDEIANMLLCRIPGVPLWLSASCITALNAMVFG